MSGATSPATPVSMPGEDATRVRENMLTHARRRAWHRLGLAVNERELVELSERIAAGKCRLVQDQDIRCTVWVRFRGRDRLVAFDKREQLVVTFLPDRCQSFDRQPNSVRRRIAHERAAGGGPARGARE